MQNLAAVRDFLEGLMPEALSVLRSMVEINSFTGNPAGVNQVGRLTAEVFAPFGFQAEFVASTNPAWGNHLFMVRKGSMDKNLFLVSHLDTVFSPEEEQRNNFGWQPERDRIYGPGTSDIKGGTVMMWLVLAALRRFAPEVFESLSWQLCWNSSEEHFATDFGELCRQRTDKGSLAALIFEGEGKRSGKPLVVVARKGRAEWRIRVGGRGAHAGVKHTHGANALVQLAVTLQKVAALTDYSRDLTFTAGRACGGTLLNRIPHEAMAEGEFRAFSGQVFEHGKRSILALAGPGEVTSPADGYPCQVSVEITSEGSPWPPNPSTEALFAVWQAAASQCGVSIDSEQRGGLSDGNFLWDAVPTLDGLGPFGDNDHCSERSPDGSKLPEFIEPASFVPKALINAVAICNLARQRV